MREIVTSNITKEQRKKMADDFKEKQEVIRKAREAAKFEPRVIITHLTAAKNAGKSKVNKIRKDRAEAAAAEAEIEEKRLAAEEARLAVEEKKAKAESEAKKLEVAEEKKAAAEIKKLAAEAKKGQ